MFCRVGVMNGYGDTYVYEVVPVFCMKERITVIREKADWTLPGFSRRVNGVSRRIEYTRLLYYSLSTAARLKTTSRITITINTKRPEKWYKTHTAPQLMH